MEWKSHFADRGQLFRGASGAAGAVDFVLCGTESREGVWALAFPPCGLT
jgi:hypothetical protein